MRQDEEAMRKLELLKSLTWQRKQKDVLEIKPVIVMLITVSHFVDDRVDGYSVKLQHVAFVHWTRIELERVLDWEFRGV